MPRRQELGNTHTRIVSGHLDGTVEKEVKPLDQTSESALTLLLFLKFSLLDNNSPMASTVMDSNIL